MTQMRPWLGMATIAAALIAIGCGSSGGGGSGGTGGGNTGAGGTGGSTTNNSCPFRPDLIAGQTVCNTVVNSATAIPFTALTGTAPTPAGGVVLDGLYESTKTGAYEATTGGGRRITFVITTDTANTTGIKHMLWNGEVLDASGTTVTTSFKAEAIVSVAGTQITNTSVPCVTTSPSPLPPAFDYTVSGNDLILSLTSGSTTAATTYTRRGCAP